MRVEHCVALAAMIASAPLAAQSTNAVATPPAGAATTPPQATSPAPSTTPAPSTAPATTGNAVGPPQLRDFSLDGTVTRPAETNAPAPGATTSAPPPTSGAAPLARATARPAASTQRTAPGRPLPGPANGTGLTGLGTGPAPVTAEPVVPAPDQTQLPALEPVTTPAAVEAPATARWPWLAALFAVVLAGAFLWWRRQQPDRERYATDDADLGALVQPRAAPSTPPPPVRAQRPLPLAPTRPAPAPPLPVPVPVPVTPSPIAPVQQPAAPAAPVGIVASGLKPRVEFALVPLLAEVDATQGAAITVEIVVSNVGSAPARNVIVDARLFNATPNVNADVGGFFSTPTSVGEQIALIRPMGSVTVRLRVAAAAASIAPIIVEGRKLLVPVVAVNTSYRSANGEVKESASFIVGRGDAEAAKLAPFRLDLGARRWSGLAARLHSNGLQPA